MPTVIPSKRNFTVASWAKPEVGWLKLITDCSSLGNSGESGARGLLRNHEGNLICAYSEYIGVGSNNKVELLEVLFGLHRYKDMGLVNIVVELDLSLVVNWLEKGRCQAWYLEDFWEEILLLIRGLNIRFHMCLEKKIKLRTSLLNVVAMGLRGNISWLPYQRN